MRVGIEQGELTAKGVQLGQVLNEVFFQHFLGVVYADWRMNLNCGDGNCSELQAERTAVVTVAALCLELGHVSLSARADGTTMMQFLSGSLNLPRLPTT